MIKNTSGQKVGAQMVTASDGSAFTGAVTVAVTVDAGTQATGSVGSGACTHEGNGFHTYAPAQAETNGDHLAFTFTGSGAVPATVQVYTAAGDAFTRLGAPAGASVSADIAAVKAETATILSDTNDIQTRIPAALVSGRMDASVGAMAANVLTASAINADAITAAKVAADVTTEIQSGLATAASITSLDGKIGTVTNLGSGATLAANLADIEAQTDDIGAAGAGLTALASAASLATVAGYLDTEIADIQSRLPAALVGGKMDANVGAISGDTVAADNLEAAADGTGYNLGGGSVVAASVTAGVTVSTNNDKAGYAIGVGGIGATAFAAGAIDNAAISANAIGASELAQDAAREIADEVLDRDIAGGASGGARNVRSALRRLRNRARVSGGTATVYQEDDTTAAWTAAVTTAAGDPVSEVDPT